MMNSQCFPYLPFQPHDEDVPENEQQGFVIVVVLFGMKESRTAATVYNIYSN